MKLSSIEILAYTWFSENVDRNLIVRNVLTIGLNIPFARKRQLFHVDLDPRWTPDLGGHRRKKNTWRSIGFGRFERLIQSVLLCRFGPPICGRGGV